MHILAAIAEFERERIRERVLAGLQRARSQGRSWAVPARGRPWSASWASLGSPYRSRPIAWACPARR
jgi:DNA invertase Pin-like site-specific DNA recombinase